MLYGIVLGFLITGIFALAVIYLKNRRQAEKSSTFEYDADRVKIDDIHKYMRSLAAQHTTDAPRRFSRQMLRKCRRNWKSLKSYYGAMRNVSDRLLSLVPSAQWLIDNYYVVNRETKIISQSFNTRTFKRIPILDGGSMEGYPRIYSIACEMLKITDMHLDEDTIAGLINSYQELKPLSIAELWAFSNILKISLIEHIGKISGSIVKSIKLKQKADEIIDEILGSSLLQAEEIAGSLIRKLQKETSLNPSFTAQIFYRLKEMDMDDEGVKQWLTSKLNGKDLDVSKAIRIEAQNQASLQVRISSAFTSLIEVSAIDWERLFEKISIIDAILSKDPSGIYTKMDFSTKDAYHHEVENLARSLRVGEVEVAEKSLELSISNAKNEHENICSHAGYYLIGKGKDLLEKSLPHSIGLFGWYLRWVKKHRGFFYFSGVVLITSLIMALTVLYTFERKPDIWMLPFLCTMIFAIILSITLALEIMNYLATRCSKPTKLPSMDFERGIPEDCRTMVVMPVILDSAGQVKKYGERIEAYYLANRDRNLYFAILGDFKDASSRDMPEDKSIIDTALNAIKELNQKYAGHPEGPFYFFHRCRKWNDKQNCWMGWERKRGKLEEFNRLILGDSNTSYNVIAGDTKIFQTLKYVITIDADTELTNGSAGRLIGIMAHPLNRPVLNAQRNKVVDGYALLQPRVGVRVNSANATFFSRTFAGQAGVDPYTNAVSDVYQDVFEEGTFSGKGIYDIRAFQQVLGDSIPENSVLSHDLLEGCYVRCALATEVELMDGYPSTVASFFAREHRWIRGDWQLLPWLFGRGALKCIYRWKILDNLRRSLLPISQLGLILLALLYLNWNFIAWGALILSGTLFSLAANISRTTFFWIKRLTANRYASGFLPAVLTILEEGILLFILIPYRAYINVDAIVRTLFRLYVSHKRLLEWKTAESVEKTISNSLKMYVKKMWIGPVSGILLLLAIPAAHRYAALIVALLWIFSPAASYLVSAPSADKHKVYLNKLQLQDLRLIARKTWRYFEEFFSAQDNWLTPDNYQEYPGDVLAHRTSPTNMGMQALSTLCAWDMGYIGINNLVTRLEKLFGTLSKMELWHGHFYNWYDTRTLSVLYPRYVSTVDSGNFISNLIVLKNGLEEAKSRPLLSIIQLEGLRDISVLAGKLPDCEAPNNLAEWRERLDSILQECLCEESGHSDNEWVKLLHNQSRDLLTDIDMLETDGSADNIPNLMELSEAGNQSARNLINRINGLISNIEKRVRETDFRPLFDARRSLFRVGFNVSANSPDSSYYDLLASESRLTSFIAIAKGDVPKKHWFKLGRPLALVHGKPALISWSGTMFEYLLPSIYMRELPGTILEQTNRLAVKMQIEYGKRKSVPWGISESGYYRFDQQLNYQYRAFGVPGLGFRSDLRKSLVIAPYAAILALSRSPREVLSNLQVLKSMGAEGRYGFYEAMDFISPNVQERRKPKLIQSFMIHHQGMSLAALNNYINHDIIRKRFHHEPIVRGSELVLEEWKPFGIIVSSDEEYSAPSVPGRVFRKKREPRVIRTTKPRYPIAHILSNNHYTIMMTSGGSSMSTWNDTVINRWRPTLTQDGYGMFFYIRDTNSKKIWSATFFPTAVEPDDYKAVFLPDKAEYIRRDGNIETRTEVVVSPQDNLEVRQLILTNRGMEQVSLEVTSYFEPVIDTYEADIAHPSFSKLFIATEYIEDKNILLATRRPRNEEGDRKYIFNTVTVKGRMVGQIEYETDRNAFIGRGNTLRNPKVLKTELPMSNNVGNVLDPVMSLRVNVSILPGRSAVVTYVTGIGRTREEALELGARCQNMHTIEDVFKMAFYDSEVEMQYLGLTTYQVNAIQDLVGSIYYPSRLMRGPVDIMEKNSLGQSSLWKFGISGDYPIILFRINDTSQIAALKDAVLAYEYLRKNGIKLDFVILNEESDDYFQPLNQAISDIISNRRIYYPNARNPGMFLLRTRNMLQEEVYLLLTVARVLLSERNGLFTRRVRKLLMEEGPDVSKSVFRTKPSVHQNIPLMQEELKNFNGIGGFTKDGKEYVVLLKDGSNTPAPWINVISNEMFGFIVSASGAGYTWAVNSRENKITTWSNDPVLDTPSEIIYIRDEDSGEFFSPTPSPVRDIEPYRIRHGFGYSGFEHNSHGIKQNMVVFASGRDPVKIYKIALENTSSHKRRLSLYFYVEWVLGVTRESNAPYIVTGFDSESGIFTAENPYNTEFKGRVAFIGSSEKIESYTGDKGEFIGIEGHYGYPHGMLYKELSNRTGAALDPCGVLKVNINMEPGAVKEVLYLLGEASNRETAVLLAEAYRRPTVSKVVLNKAKSGWNKILEQIQVNTPDEEMNILLNGWLLYQVLSCRFKARAAFYQCGGAYGFRDQLQDIMSLFNTMPGLCRNHILKCCSRQFIEGDVQHWWHEGLGKGVRTRITDDLLWLPYVTAAYIESTGDIGILDETVAYLDGDKLEQCESERYFIPSISEEKGSVYEHCIRAIEKGLQFGERGLPLIGTGDWNDGMNRVGWKGKGESVWLAWFLYKVLMDFISVCGLKNDSERIERYKKIAGRILDNVENNGWDGEWYLRAYFDSGQPLGSRQNSECRIDSISQSWSIISGGANAERAARAMESLQKYLVKEEDQMMLLLTPPFDRSCPDPGYIKGYLPGIRENGGQYTHGVVWNIVASAAAGNGDAAYKMFRMLNPINHAKTYSDSVKYKLEPYVMPADVYSKFPHAGRGGWSWYTGSAGWMYQAGIQWILGIRRKGDRLLIDPVIPAEWKRYSVTYKYRNTEYFIEVENPEGISHGSVCLKLDGQDVAGEGILLQDDGVGHRILAVMQS